MERGKRFMQEKINLAIIGGGASGLIAAITASKICKQTNRLQFLRRFAGRKKAACYR